MDTEQSHYHCLKVMKRILRLTGLPDDRDNEHLEFLALRKYTPEQRIRIVEQAIYNTPDIGLVIIDGIRDMVYDINSPGESTRIISKLMQWTDDRQIHIHTILHQNKGDEKRKRAYRYGAEQQGGNRSAGGKGQEQRDISNVSPCTSVQWISSLSLSRINDNALPELHRGVQTSKRRNRKTGEEKFDPYRHIYRTTAPHSTGSGFPG